ncbi:hypothetical protein Acsp05_60020 [Actinokineospora sp. NBRC 105648]|nr:hypothetical protein Acsp05_60020 [Actinokineospora sp. NBRC 105648]
MRGPGNGLVGYCGLVTTYDGTAGSKVALRAATRAASAVPVQVLVNPTASAFTSDSGVSVAAGTYKVVVTPVGQATRTLAGALPAVAAGLYPATSWLSPSGVPKQLAFGFVGSTGSVTDVHEISGVKVLTFNPVPQLAVGTTSYSAATSQPGDPVTYKIAASVLAGADETSPVSITQTVPTGVVAVGGYGTGWVCQAPVGRVITCTTSGSAFANGTALPVLTVVAIVTAANMTAATVQSASPTGVTAADANPAAAGATAAGTLPTAPAAITVTPAIGSVSGGGTVTVGGTNITAATAIEIGTAAQQQAGTPVTLLPCPGAAAPGCFTVSGGTLVISSMPARTGAAAVTVTVVTSGVAAAASYAYVDRPATPAAPSVAPGITSATVTWVAPATNGSPITGYTVTPYRAGVAQVPSVFDATTTTRTLTGLTADTSYTFTVAATNAYGTSAASPASAAVVPYTVPGAPVITATSAGSLAAVLTWTAPANGGSAITGYRVVPYIGAVAQTPQTFTGTGTTQTVTGLTAGTAYTFTVAAQNLAGTGPPSAASPSVTPNQSPSLTFPAPPAGEVGVAYSRQLTVTNGTAPVTWSISAGALPDGLTLASATGLLSGTPTAAGSFSSTVRVVDASGLTATKAVTLVIAAAPALVFAPAPGEVGVAYSQQPTLTGGTGPFTWAVTAGGLPAGVTLNSSTGLLSGTPTAAGSFAVTIAATDSFAQTAARTVTVVIAARPTFTDGALPSGQVGLAYSHSFEVAGGVGPLVWSIPAGSPPAGLALTPGTGVLSGTPTAVGSSSFTVVVTDANNQTASKAVTLVVTAGPLVITKTADVSSAAPGSAVAYTITITNSSTSPFTAVGISDPLTGVLDDAAYGANATASSGTVSYTAPTLGWTGTVPASGSVTITYSVTVNNPVAGNKVLANTVSSATLGANCASGAEDSRCTATVTVPGLAIVKTADTATTTPGGTVRFQVVVTNTGQTAYPAATLTDSLAGVLDDAAYNGDGTATSGNVVYTASALTWTGQLAPGATATITYSVTVANPDTGDRSLTGTVISPSAGSSCPSGAAVAQCTATVAVLIPALVITNSAATSTTTPGATVAYTVTLSNTGQTAYTGTSAAIALAGALDDATYAGDAAATSGTAVFSSGVVTWTGDLAVGAQVTITLSVVVRVPDPGDKVLTTVVTSAAAGSTCPVGGSNPGCTSTVQVRIPGMTITAAADTATTTPGSVVHHTVSVTNTGQTPYAGATFSAALAGVLDDATYNGDAAASGGSASVTGATLTWVGDLATGATATITYSVTVNDPDTGNLLLITSVTSATTGSNCPSGGTDPRCASTVTVLVPGLSITAVADTATTTPGSVVRYNVTVVNTGQTDYHDLPFTLDLSDALDDADYNYDAVVSTGGLVANPDGTVFWVLDLAPGASAVGTISVTVRNPPTGNRSLVLIAVVDAPGSPCATGSAVVGCRTTVTVLVPGLTITKTADTTTSVPGGTVGYTIAVVNDGETAFAAAAFADDLAIVFTDASYGGDATATTGTVALTGSTLGWTGALAPGATATITYSVTVNDPDTGDKRLFNTVTSTTPGGNCPAGGADPRCAATVTVLVPGLTSVTTASPATTVPGAVVGFTTTVTNSGATALTWATIALSLTGALDDADYAGGASADTGVVGYSGSTLTWTGDLAIGATAVISYAVTVHTATGGDNLVTVTSASSTSGANCAPGGTDPRCAVTVPVARLVLTYGYIAPTITPGGMVQYLATFTNTGQVPYVDIAVAFLAPDTVDDALPGGNQTASSGTLLLSASGITWTGSIPVGGVVDLAATLLIQNPDLGDRILIATIESAAPGNNCPAGGTDPRCTSLVTVVVPALTVAKTANTTYTGPGGTVGYTITAHNTGETPYTGATISDTLVGVLDDANYNGDAAASTGVVSFSSPTLSWTGDLAVGATATITYSVTAHVAGGGDKTMVNPVSSTTVGSTCAPASPVPACHSTVAVLTPGLTIEKTADLANATLGTEVTYTVVTRNSGQTPQTAATFTDPLTDVLDDAVYDPDDTTASSGTVGYTDGVLTWSGSLAPGASATVSYTATINTPASGDRTMVNTVTSTSAGANCASGSTDPRCTATVAVINAVSLTFTKTAGVAATVAGGVVAYTVTVANSTEAALTGVAYTDPLGGVLDDADYNGDALASSGTIGLSGTNLIWTGTVAALSTVTVTYSVTVHATTTGDQVLDGAVSSTSLPESDNCAPGSGDPRCTAPVPVAGLVLEQHFTEATTTPGSVVRLTATFTNTGALPYTGITVSSPSAGVVDDAIPVGDQTASSGTLVLSSTAITWTGDVPVGGVITISGTVTVQNPDLGDRFLTGTLVSSALGNNCPAGGTDPRCVSGLVVQLPELTIAKTSNTPYTLPGGTVGFTVTIHNTGEAAYTGATVSDTFAGLLDDAAYDGNAIATSGTLAFSSPVLTWTGDLAAGATATITYTTTARDPGTGDKTMLNAVSSDVAGSTCPTASPNTACRSIVVVLTPLLTVVSAADTSTTVPGATVGYTVTATNTGQTVYPAADITIALSGVLDDATYAGDASASSGSVQFSAPALSWTGTLYPGSTVTISYSVVVDQPVTGDFRLDQTAASASAGSTCPAAGNDPRCATSVPVASMHIVNATDVATAKPTSVVRTTVTLTNTGQVPYFGAVVSDSLVGSLDDATYNGDAQATTGSLRLEVGTGRVVWTGDLAIGESVAVTGSVTVANPPPGDRVLTSLVTSDAPATNCPTADPGPECATSVAVLMPALTIVKAADTTLSTPGGTVGYTITISDTGETPYTAATVLDSLAGVLPDATYAGDATATSGSVVLDGETLTWTGDLAVGQSVVVGYSVRVDDPDLGDKNMVNVVRSDELGSSCPSGAPAPGCAVQVMVRIPALDIAITADRTSTVPGGTVGYTVTVRNAGQTAYLTASVTTPLAGILDDAAYNGDAVATAGTVTLVGQSLTWAGDLAIGATAVTTFTVTVADPDLGNRVLAASVGSAEPGSTCGTQPQCASTVAVLIPGLSVAITAGTATATPGERIAFTITIANTGQTPYPEASVSTALTDILDDAEFDGVVTASSGVPTYTAPALGWTGSLAVGATATIGFAVTVRDPDPGDKALSTTVVSQAQGSSCPVGSGNPACTAAVTVLVPALTLVIVAGAPVTTPGAVVEYTIVITNTGQTAYLGAVVTNALSAVLPDADYNGDAEASSGVLGYEDQTLTWTGDLPVAASAVITYSITVHDPDTGDKQMDNRVASTSPGSTCPPESASPACVAQVRVLVPALLLTKAADTAVVIAGGTVTYTVTLLNSGETDYLPASFTDPLVDVLDDADYGGDATAGTGTVEYADGTLTWSGALAVGETAVITYSAAVRFPAGGDRSLANTVTSATQGGNCATGADPRCGAVVAVLVPGLDIAKTADASQVVAGGTLGYTVTATNTGAADYPAAALVDSLTGVLDDAAYNGDATATTGTVSYVDEELGWTGALPVGATVVIRYSVTAALGGTGDGSLDNRVRSLSVGGSCAADSTDPRCTTSTGLAARTLTLSGLTPSFTLTGLPGSTVSADGVVTMTVTTNSSSGYAVTVRATGAVLAPATPGNTASIPVGLLGVRENGAGEFRGLSADTPLVVHQQGTPSGPQGDAVSNDYRIQIPFIESDTYSVTLEYIAGAL